MLTLTNIALLLAVVLIVVELVQTRGRARAAGERTWAPWAVLMIVTVMLGILPRLEALF